MTREEAIETLKANYPDACFGQLREAVDKAIEALSADVDAISRQQAIDAMMALKAEDDEMYGCSIPESFDGERAVETLRKLPSAQPERKTGRWIETEGLDEEIRCTMCTNPMHSDRGCDGSCQYDEKLYKRIMSIINDRIDGGGA